MSEFITTASAEFAREFIRQALPHLPGGGDKLRGMWAETNMNITKVVNHTDTDESVRRDVSFATRIYQGPRIYANGMVAREGDRWCSATFVIQIPGDTSWKVSGQMNRKGECEFFNPRVLQDLSR